VARPTLKNIAASQDFIKSCRRFCFGIDAFQINMAPEVLAYYDERELGISGTKVGKRLAKSRSAVIRAVESGSGRRLQ